MTHIFQVAAILFCFPSSSFPTESQSLYISGIGYGMVIISGVVCVYYNIIITWTLYYFFHSFYPTLPWSTCDNAWNTEHCALKNRHDNSTGNETEVVTIMDNLTGTVAPVHKRSPSEEFWE